ncbi:YlxR family protein [Nesterenkonia aerolata]|uniref:YlxR family protein n=1 Tax=Nesterenkonia aerolata TaxID=3074079 RepID=A0ABU2DND0_9MICC|nr:YlxR family protein [Nesterenkonia sp. LY-0111]MDR8018017.1 YlxR family protein [Nesterenkonia sp. LY-0111]
MVPVRTCVGCRRRVEQGDVVRFALAPESEQGDGGALPRVVPDLARRRIGRGAWLHPQEECLEQAVRRKAFHRAFRRPVSVDGLEMTEVIRQVAARRPLHVSDESGFESDGHPMSIDG